MNYKTALVGVGAAGDIRGVVNPQRMALAITGLSDATKARDRYAFIICSCKQFHQHFEGVPDPIVKTAADPELHYRLA